MNFLERKIEQAIIFSRWIQVPLYLGLILASVLYSYKFLIELAHLTLEIQHLKEEHVMLGILTLVDITMVLNLLIMVIMGGYATFVSHIDFGDHEDRPDWLEKVDAGALKIKLATALISISAIHLLKSFINIENKDQTHLIWQVVIHFSFLFSALILALTEKIMHGQHKSSGEH